MNNPAPLPLGGDNFEPFSTVSQSAPRGLSPSCPQPQTVGNIFFIDFLPFLTHVTTPLLALPGIALQMNGLHSHILVSGPSERV